MRPRLPPEEVRRRELERTRQYYAENREKILEKQRRRQTTSEHKRSRAAYMRLYRRVSYVYKNYIDQYGHDYRELNKENLREQSLFINRQRAAAVNFLRERGWEIGNSSVDKTVAIRYMRENGLLHLLEIDRGPPKKRTKMSEEEKKKRSKERFQRYQSDQQWREQRNEKRRQARVENPEKAREKTRRYIVKIRDRRNELKRRWYEENQEKENNRSRRWHDEAKSAYEFFCSIGIIEPTTGKNKDALISAAFSYARAAGLLSAEEERKKNGANI
jgi:hypothetical protein